jgi:hypothetical protein
VPRPASVADLASRAEAVSAGPNSVEMIYPAVRPLGGERPAPVATDVTFSAPVARYAPDAVFVAEADQATRVLLPEVRGYAVTRRGARGALEGAIIGTAIGAVAGALLGASMGSDPPPQRTCTPYDGGEFCTTVGDHGLSAGEKAGLTGAGLGVIGAGLGAVIGVFVGHTDRYEF